MVRKQIVWGCCLICVFFSVVSWSQRIDCTVNVVDVSAQPVAGAEVVIYEHQSDWILRKEKSIVLFGPEPTGADGHVLASFGCERMEYVMVVARKEGYALGWDVLPYEDMTEPTINLILDRPVPFAGRVLDATGRPAAGARVQAQPKISKMERLRQSPVLGPEAWMSVQTDADGRFGLDCFGEDVRCDLFVTTTGSETAYHFTPYYMNSDGYVIGGGEVGLRLPGETTVQGQVVDEEGKGVGGTEVYLSRNRREEGFYRNNYVSQYRVTDAEGRFVFDGVPKVSHLLRIQNADASRPLAGKTLMMDGAGEAVDDLTILLETGGVMEVTLIDEVSQEPIEGATAIFMQEPANEKERWFYQDLATDAAGRVKAVLPTGAIRFSCSDNRYQRNQDLELPEVKRAQTAAVRFELTPHPMMTGTVKDMDGQAAAGAAVRLVQGPQVLTDERGTFRFPVDRIAEGACLVARDVRRNLACIVSAGDPAETKTLGLEPARTIRGTVEDMEGVPIAAARVEVDLHWPGYQGVLSEEVLTDGQGTFEVRAIPENLPEDTELRLSVVTMNHGAVDFKRLSIHREDDEVVELMSVKMHPADHVISGSVVDTAGKPMAELPIYLYGAGQYSHTVVTDADGGFEMRRLCEGEVQLQAGIGGRDFEPGRMTAHAGDTEIRIVMGQQLVHVPRVSLAGKPLPGWEGVRMKGAFEDVDGGPRLICFWDFGQRSSRHTVSELVKRQGLLAEQKLHVILVHSTSLEPRAEEWISRRNAGFSLGEVPAESKVICKQWGVQGLPWLILTDGEGKVVAEGISVAELEERLGEQ